MSKLCWDSYSVVRGNCVAITAKMTNNNFKCATYFMSQKINWILYSCP